MKNCLSPALVSICAGRATAGRVTRARARAWRHFYYCLTQILQSLWPVGPRDLECRGCWAGGWTDHTHSHSACQCAAAFTCRHQPPCALPACVQGSTGSPRALGWSAWLAGTWLGWSPTLHLLPVVRVRALDQDNRAHQPDATTQPTSMELASRKCVFLRTATMSCGAHRGGGRTG